MNEHNDLPTDGIGSTNSAPMPAPPGPSTDTMCPRCGSALLPSQTSATTYCSCGLQVATAQIKEMNYLRVGLPQWANRLNVLDGQIREHGIEVQPAVMQEAMQLQQGLPAWQARLDLLTDALARIGAGARPIVPTSAGVDDLGDRAPKISAYRLVLTLGALLFISGAAALAFFVGSNYGQYAQLAVLLILCGLFGWGSVASRERTQSTSTALSAITVGGWFFTMIWFGYKLVGSEFWRMSSPVAMGLAAMTAVVLYYAGKRTRTDLWVFSGYISGTLTVALTCLYAATTVQRLGATSPTVGNAVLTLPLSLMAVLALQDRLRVFTGRTAARLTSAYIALAVALAVAVPSLTVFLNSPDDETFSSRTWQSAGLLTWSGHVAAIAFVLFRSKQRTSPITAGAARCRCAVHCWHPGDRLRLGTVERSPDRGRGGCSRSGDSLRDSQPG